MSLRVLFIRPDIFNHPITMQYNKTPGKVPLQHPGYPSPYPHPEHTYVPIMNDGTSPYLQKPMTIPKPTYTSPMPQNQINMQMNPTMMPGFVNKNQLPSQFTPKQQIPFPTPPINQKPVPMQYTPGMQPSQYIRPPIVQPMQQGQQLRPKDVKSRVEDSETKRAMNPDYKTPFGSIEDIRDRLGVYRVFNINSKHAEDDWDVKVTEVTKRFVKHKEKLTDAYSHLVNRDSRHLPSEEMLFMDLTSLREEQKLWEDEKKKILEKREMDRIAMNNLGNAPISFKLGLKKEQQLFSNVLGDDDDSTPGTNVLFDDVFDD